MRIADQADRGSRRLAMFAVSLLIGTLAGCGGTHEAITESERSNGVGPSSPTPAPLRVAAASDLQLVLPRVKDRFTARFGIAVDFSFGSSGHLAEQIKAGAPFDIFLAANQGFVRELANQGLIKPESIHSYARGTLVVAVYHAVGGEVRPRSRI